MLTLKIYIFQDNNSDENGLLEEEALIQESLDEGFYR
jgi:hypothetical protein